MAKISPVSIKYMIHANFTAEGALEKPDVIGALFGQTEGLLGAELEMRDLQKEGKIGRIEVDLERKDKRTTGLIKIPTALDQSETTLIAAAIETIERIGPCDSQIEILKIEDVRGSKRDYIIERAKKLMQSIDGSTNSKEISNTIKDSARMASIQEYGEEKLPCGDLSGKEIIVVEGRADVVNLLKNGINNVIAMNGTKLPETIKELSKKKDIILFVDGDRGGRLIIDNVTKNVEIKYVAIAPDGKEVEELAGKEIWMSLRKKIITNEFFSKNGYSKQMTAKEEKPELKEKLKKISEELQGTGKAILVDDSLEEIKKSSIKTILSAIEKSKKNLYAIVIDGTASGAIIYTAKAKGCKIIVAKNFATTDPDIRLISL